MHGINVQIEYLSCYVLWYGKIHITSIFPLTVFKSPAGWHEDIPFMQSIPLSVSRTLFFFSIQNSGHEIETHSTTTTFSATDILSSAVSILWLFPSHINGIMIYFCIWMSSLGIISSRLVYTWAGQDLLPFFFPLYEPLLCTQPTGYSQAKVQGHISFNF